MEGFNYNWVDDGSYYKESVFPPEASFMKLKEGRKQDIFFLFAFAYTQAVIFTEKIKHEIKSKFYMPEIYKIEDFYLTHNNNGKSGGSGLPDTV